MVTDHHDSWEFRLVHIGLAAVSVVFAVVIWQVTGRTRRFTKDVERNFGYRPAVLEQRRKARSAEKAATGRDEPIVVSAKPAD
jgi:hypothetical protein